MKRKTCIIIFSILLTCGLLNGCKKSEKIVKESVATQNDTLDYFSTQRKGANGSMHKLRPEWFKAASELGLEYIRFNPDFLPAAEKDFLIGDADNFTEINQTDLTLLKEVLDEADHNHLKVVLTMFSLPGRRYNQRNNGIDDYRLWQNESYQKQAIEFWKELAVCLKDHPAIVGYNILNEPMLSLP